MLLRRVGDEEAVDGVDCEADAASAGGESGCGSRE
jgi:hypothetical protein